MQLRSPRSPAHIKHALLEQPARRPPRVGSTTIARWLDPSPRRTSVRPVDSESAQITLTGITCSVSLPLGRSLAVADLASDVDGSCWESLRRADRPRRARPSAQSPLSRSHAESAIARFARSRSESSCLRWRGSPPRGRRGSSPLSGRTRCARRTQLQESALAPSPPATSALRGVGRGPVPRQRDGTNRGSGPPTPSGTAAQEWFVVCDSLIPGPVHLNPAEERRRDERADARGPRPRGLEHQAHSPSLTPVAPRPGDHCPRGRPRARAPRSRRRSPHRSRRSWPHADRS